MDLDTRLSVLKAAIEKKRQVLDIPAAMVLIVDKDKVLLSEAFGVANRETQQAVTLDDYFRIGSITKTFTALATLRLVEQGKIALGDKLHQLAEELDVQNPWQQTHPIILQHLLEHTAGFNDLTAKEFDFNEPLSLEDAFKLSPGSRVSRWPPGLHHSYSNISPGLLSYVIEKISGTSFEDFMKNEVLEPLDMANSTLSAEQAVLENLITGYDRDGKTPIPYWHMTYRAFGALNVKLSDMVPFLQLFLNQGMVRKTRFLSKENMALMESPRTTLAGRSGLGFGYGSNLYSFFRKGHVFYGHGGDADGYLSRFAYQKESGLAYFVGINVFRGNDLTAIRNLVEDFIIENLPRPVFPKIKISIASLNNYVGEYESVTWRFPNAESKANSTRSLNVVIQQNRLFIHETGGGKRELIPVSKKHFRFKNESQATVAFIQYDGAIFLQMADGNYRHLND